jgi:hypothetical protein
MTPDMAALAPQLRWRRRDRRVDAIVLSGLAIFGGLVYGMVVLGGPR